MKEKFMSILTKALEIDVPVNYEIQLETLDWDSIAQLDFALLIDEEWQVNLTGWDIHRAKTVQDLFDEVEKKRKDLV